MKKLLLALLLPAMLSNANAQNNETVSVSTGATCAGQFFLEGINKDTPKYKIKIALIENKNGKIRKLNDFESSTYLGQAFVFQNSNVITYTKEIIYKDGITKIVPGTLSSGINGYVYPKLMGKHIVTDVCINLVDLISLDNQGSAKGMIQIPQTNETYRKYSFDFSTSPTQSMQLTNDIEVKISAIPEK